MTGSPGDGARRIGIFVPTLLGGGAEHVMVTLANGISERGIAVDLLVGSPDGPNRQRVDPGVNLVDLGASSVLRCVQPLANYLTDARPTAMLSAMTHANNAAILARSLARSNARLVISERTSIRYTPVNWRETLHGWLRKWTYRHADALVLVAHEERAAAASRFHMMPDKVVGIYSPLITDDFERDRLLPPTHPWLLDRDPLQRPVIVSVGRLDPIKNYNSLIDAFAMLRKRRPTRLIIFGEGEQRAELGRQVAALGLKACVSLPGFAQNPAREMNAGDLFVLSSLFEGLPGALVQALGCGLRIVSTDCHTGPREILRNGQLGALVAPGDTKALASAMDAALDRAPPGPMAREQADLFSLPTAVDAYLAQLMPEISAAKS